MIYESVYWTWHIEMIPVSTQIIYFIKYNVYKTMQVNTKRIQMIITPQNWFRCGHEYQLSAIICLYAI